MVFSSPTLPPLGFLLSLLLMHSHLHHIFKLAIHICRNLDHMHFLATSLVRLLLMHIVSHGSSPTNIMLGVLHMLCSFSLLVWLATNYC
jgi:hypothetical protein